MAGRADPSRRKGIESRNHGRVPIPGCAARHENTSVGRRRHVGIQAAGRDHGVPLRNSGQRGSAGGAETSGMPCSRQAVGRYLVPPREPFEPGRGREQIRGMRRAGVLAAIRAMAQVEALEFTVDLEGHVTAQTRTHMLLRHWHGLPHSIGHQIKTRAHRDPCDFGCARASIIFHPFPDGSRKPASTAP